MTRILLSFAIIFASFSHAFCYTIAPKDSIGVEKKGDKSFIIYRVEQGQTLFSILKKYKCSKEEFLTVNPYLQGAAKVAFDQIIRIPMNPKPKAAQIAKAEKPVVSEKSTIIEPKKQVQKVEVIAITDSTPTKEKQASKVEIIDPDAPKATTEPKTVVKDIVIPEKTVLVKPKTHKVTSPTETLFGIALKYKVRLSQLIAWNKLKSDYVKLNQVLIVENPATVGTEIAKTTVSPAKDSATMTKISAVKPKKDSTLVVKTPAKKPKKDSLLLVKTPLKKSKKDSLVAKTTVKTPQGPAADVEKVKPPTKAETKPAPTTPTYVPNAPGGKKNIENGVAEVIDAGEKTDKYLALHKTAPVGTLIQVRNEANGLSVWVKVIGKLPESGETIIKISPKAFEKLQPRDKRIRAEISYVK